MSNPTTNMALAKAVDSDNAETYLTSNLATALDTLDTHDHSASTKGLAVARIQSGAAASKPAAGAAAGTVYLATDTSQLYGSTGAASVLLTPVVGGITPSAIGTAAAGSSTTASSADHVHAMTTTTTVLGADVTGIGATYTDGVTVSLANGTYVLLGQLYLSFPNTVAALGRILVGSTTLSTGTSLNDTGIGTLAQIFLTAVYTVSGGPLTVHLQASFTSSTGSIKAASTSGDTTAVATQLIAIRVG